MKKILLLLLVLFLSVPAFSIPEIRNDTFEELIMADGRFWNRLSEEQKASYVLGSLVAFAWSNVAYTGDDYDNLGSITKTQFTNTIKLINAFYKDGDNLKAPIIIALVSAVKVARQYD